MYVIIKTLVAKFYERNAGLLFFIFFIMFGVVESGQILYYHLSLIYGLMEAPVFLAIVCAVWVLYVLRMVQFTFNQLAKTENSFLFDLAKLNSTQSLMVLFVSQILMYEPVLFYSIFILGVAISTNHFAVTVFILGFHVC
jgi:hypothetical protein